MDEFSMSTDDLQLLIREKGERFDANCQAIDKAYVEHEDFIADFDATLDKISHIDAHGRRWPTGSYVTTETLAEFVSLRDRVFEMLLGPCGPDRDAPRELFTGEVA
jgi:hypothetical protein